MLRAWALPAFVVLIYCFMLAPVLIVFPISVTEQQYVVFPPTGFTLRWYENFLDSDEFMSALYLSLRLTVSATLIATIIGTAAAVALVRYRFPCQQALKAFFVSPIIVPGLVLGIAMLIFFGPTLLHGTFAALLIAHVIVILPYVIRVVSANLVGLDIRIDHAAQSLGATRLQVFGTVTLPLLRPGIVAGAMLAFVQSFDELIVSLFLTGPQLSTLPVKIYHYIEYNSDPTIAALSVVVVVISGTLILLTERFVGLSRFL